MSLNPRGSTLQLRQPFCIKQPIKDSFFPKLPLKHKKSVGLLLLLVLRTEALALPIVVERATREPTPGLHGEADGWIPGSSTVAMFMTTIGNLRDSSPSRTERLVNAFIMSHLRSHPSASPWRPGVGSRHGHLQTTVSLTFHRTNSTFLAVPRAKLANNFKMDLFFFKIFHLFSTSPSGLGNITPCSGHP